MIAVRGYDGAIVAVLGMGLSGRAAAQALEADALSRAAEQPQGPTLAQAQAAAMAQAQGWTPPLAVSRALQNLC